MLAPRDEPPIESPPPIPATETPRERRHLGLRRLLEVLLAGLAVAIVVGLLDGSVTILEIVQLVLLVAIVGVFVAQRRTARAAGHRRQAREQWFTRILQGLSRSVSAESVVDAIIDELRATSGADDVVVARQTQSDGTMEVTLVAAGPTVPTSRTYLRPDIATPPTGVEIPTPVAGTARPKHPALQLQEAADEVARRVRSGYGLPNTLAAPLVADGRRFVGALVLSKRTRDSWSEIDRRLLTWAAGEVSAAFARAYALEAAETRANMDALTGLPNRRYLDELVAIVQPRRRTGDTLGVLMIDIDRFKKVNDRYGHATGDAVLRAVAGAIYVTIRAEDTPARYGGEEFAVILRRASGTQATEVAERIRVAVSAIPPERMGLAEHVTVSVGVAVASEDDQDVRALIERADRALYLAKRRGRDRVEAA